MSRCPDENTIVSFVERTAPDATRVSVEQHLEGCAECRLLVVSMADSLGAPLDGAPGDQTQNADGTVTAVGGPEPAPLRAGPLLVSGDVVGHFKVVRPVGRGGMGEVYLARDQRLGRRVALKVIQPRSLAVARGLFLREAETTARLSHPHIVQIFDVGEHRGLPFLALEFLAGTTLRTRLQVDGLPPVAEATRMGIAIAEALAHAHAAGVIHRDLKPENVFLPTDGRLRVVDFGIAHAVSSTIAQDVAQHVTPVASGDRADARVSGTPTYMAPEQWRGDEPTPALDLWALGVLLHELFTGVRPYEAGAAPVKDLVALAVRVAGAEAAPLTLDPAVVPAAIVDVITRCLAKDPTARPTAADVARQLAAALEPERARLQDPFRGLAAFSEEHAASYFGREAEVGAFLERERAQSFLPVVGPSGRGKSSFVAAGVIPRMKERGRFRVLRLRPGAAPIDALARALGTPDRARALERSPELLAVIIDELGVRTGERALLFVDQLEELWTLGAPASEQQVFVRALLSVTGDGGHGDVAGGARVIVTVRDDFVGRLAETIEIVDPGARMPDVIALRALDRAALRVCIERPLLAAGGAVDDASLIDTIVDDLATSPAAALPLLQLCAQLLWDRRDPQTRTISRAAYTSLGGVRGVLATHAESVVGALPPHEQRVLRQLLLRLVTSQRTKRRVSESELVRDLGDGGRALLKRLVDARLVLMEREDASIEASAEGAARAAATDAGASGAPGDRAAQRATVELAHESLIAGWPRLSRIVDESREELAHAAELADAARLWERRGRRAEELWGGLALAEGVRHFAAAARSLTHEDSTRARAFLDAGAAREGRARTRRRAWLASAAVALVIATVASVALAAQYRANERRARQGTLEAQVEGARAAQLAGDPLTARAMVRSALEADDFFGARARWWAINQDALLAKTTGIGLVRDIAVSADGTRVASTNGWQALVRDPRSLSELAYSNTDPGALKKLVALTTDAKKLAWAGESLMVLDVDSGALDERMAKNGDEITAVTFAPTGNAIVAGTRSRKLLAFPTEGPPTSVNLEDLPDAPVRVVFLDDDTLVVGVRNWSLSIYRITSDERGVPRSASRIAEIGVAGGVRSLSMVPKLGRAVVGTGSGHVVMVDAAAIAADAKATAGGRAVASELAAKHVLFDVAISTAPIVDISRAGTPPIIAAVPHQEGRVVMLDGDTGHALGAFPHSEAVAVTLSRDGLVLSGGMDSTLQVRSAKVLLASKPAAHRAAVIDATFSPDGARAASVGTDGWLRFWDTATGAILDAVHVRDAQLDALLWIGDTVIVGAFDGSVIFVDANAPAHQRVLKDESMLLVRDVREWPGTGKAIVRGDDGARLVLDVAKQAIVAVHSRIGAGDGDAGEGWGLDVGPKHFAHPGRLGWLAWRDNETGKLTKTLPVPFTQTWSVAVAQSEQFALVNVQGKLTRVDLETGALRDVFASVPRGFRMDLTRDDRTVSVGLANGAVAVVDVESGRARELLGHHNEVYTTRFDARGERLLSGGWDSSVRLWDARTGRPLWLGAAWEGPPLAGYTHRGFVGDGVVSRTNALRAALEQRAMRAAVSRAFACILTTDARVEIWDVTKDVRTADVVATGVWDVAALVDGCALAGPRGVVLLNASGAEERVIAGAVNAVLQRDDAGAAGRRELLVVRDGVASLTVIDENGDDVARVVSKQTPTALATAKDRIAIGFEDGNVAVVSGIRLAGELALDQRELLKMDSHVRARVTRVVASDNGVVVAGTTEGEVAAWRAETGEKLFEKKMQGEVSALFFDGAKLVAATDVGDVLEIDASALTESYCGLLQRVWRDVPVVVVGGRVKTAPPPDGHRCWRAQ